jgi:hypothetical protein
MYEDREANVIFADAETHEEYRGFAIHGSMMASLFYLTMADELGIDLTRLHDFTNPNERLLLDALQRIAQYDYRVSGKNLKRYMREHGGTFHGIVNEFARLPDLGPDEIAELLRRAGKFSRKSGDIRATTMRLEELYTSIHGTSETEE